MQDKTILQARALYYDFFAGFFLYELLDERKNLFEKQVATLSAQPLSDGDEAVFENLGAHLKSVDSQNIKDEYASAFNLPFVAVDANAKKSELSEKSAQILKNLNSDNLDSQNLPQTQNRAKISQFMAGLEDAQARNAKKADFENLDSENADDGLTKSERKSKRKNASNLKGAQIFLYLSHYVEGCINGQSLLKVKDLVRKSPFRLNASNFKESEEHLGFLLLLCENLLLDAAQNQNLDSENLQNQIFKECVKPFAFEVARLLKNRADLKCYSLVGALLESFLNVEDAINS